MRVPNCGVPDSDWLKEREPKEMKQVKNGEQAEVDLFTPMEMPINPLKKHWV